MIYIMRICHLVVHQEILTATNLNPDSTEVKWTEKNGATEWEIEYDVSGTALGSGIRKNYYYKSGYT